MGLSENFWINLLGFQLAWWLCILQGNQALLPVIVLLMLHLALHRQPADELRVVLICALLGCGIDLMLTLAGVFYFTQADLIIPLWLLALWCAFAATLRQSLALFRTRYLLAAFCGAVFGAATYVAAARFGAVTLGLGYTISFLLLAAVWSVLFPMLIWISERQGGVHEALQG